jgi:hypothetical protein
MGECVCLSIRIAVLLPQYILNQWKNSRKSRYEHQIVESHKSFSAWRILSHVGLAVEGIWIGDITSLDFTNHCHAQTRVLSLLRPPLVVSW